MSNQDEFESLIRNFKLDDPEISESHDAPRETRRPFDYDDDAALPVRQAVAVPRRAAPAPAPAPYRARAEQPAPRGNKQTFRVNIDDEEFYEPSAPARPVRGGNGGGSGGNRGSGGGRDDDEPPTGSGAGRWAKALIVLVVVLAASVFLAFFAIESAGDMFGLNKPDAEIAFQLPGKLTMSEIAAKLKDEGIIAQPLVFRLYGGLKKYKAEEFHAGAYELNSNMSYEEIFIKFSSKRGAIKKEVKLLFIEGNTLAEVADKLEKSKVVSKKDLFDYLEKGDFPWNYKFLKQPLPTSENRYLNYEGYFFPDTYIFTEDMTPAEVTMKFFSNFNAKIDDELYAQMEKLEMTLDETIILASIIQKEAGMQEEMGKVSSVFHNRLNDPKTFPHLDSDVTSFYVAYDIMPAMGEDVKDSKDKTYKDFKHKAMYEAYDTYSCIGLPIGAICNPGLDAIKAALNPGKTDYKFFVTDADGKYYYAKTSAEHDQNVAVAMPKGDVHGTGVDTTGNTSSAAE